MINKIKLSEWMQYFHWTTVIPFTITQIERLFPSVMS